MIKSQQVTKGIPISKLEGVSNLTGDEDIPIVKNGRTVSAKIGEIKHFTLGDINAEIESIKLLTIQAEEAANSAELSEQESTENKKASELNKRSAESSAENAARSEQNAATSEGNSAQSAEDSAESARLAGLYKDAAALSEQGAKSSEDAAAEYAEEAKGAAAGSLKTQNNLSEFAEADDKALAEIHKNLKLGTAAAKEMQSDVYDRTAGCVPLPGAFGFGAQLASKQVIAVGDEGQNNFQAHFNSKPPGRYLVRGLKNDYPISGMNFDGLVDVKWLSPSDASTARNVPKIAIFYGPKGAMYRSHCNGGYWSGWTDISPESAQRLTLQTMRTSEGANMPQVGGIVLAMVKNPGPNRTVIRRGETYPGSYLLSVKLNGGNGEPINCLYNQASTAYPGSYVAMFSGNDAPLEPGESFITLFMRVL